MKHRISFVIAYMCLLGLFTLGLAELLLGERDERPSLTENRMLQPFPELSGETLFSGAFTEDFEAWLSDAFFGRDRLAALSEKALAVFSLDGGETPPDLEGAALFEEREEDAAEREWLEEHLATPAPAEENAAPPAEARDASLWLLDAKGERKTTERYPAAALTRLATALDAYRVCLPEDGSVHFINVPISKYSYRILHESCTGWGSDMPEALQELVGEGVYIYDATEILDIPAGERLYPISDHHWHTLGAWKAAKAMLERQGLPVLDYYDFRYSISSSQSGRSYDRRALEGMSLNINDFLIPQPLAPVKSEILTHLTQRRESVYIDLTRTGYRQLLGGSYTPWRLFEGGFHTGRTALVIGDSFENSFIPYLLPYYDTVLSTDYRVGKYSPIEAGANAAQYMETYGVSDVYVVTCTSTPVTGDMLQEDLLNYLYLDYGGEGAAP